MKVRAVVKSASTLLAATSILLLSGCGSGGGSSHGGEQVTPSNRYKQTNLVASNPAYKPLFLDASFVNAWG
ncbi:MAG: hypothetical protein EOO68_41065, partial [Moraxellaceae bacterium]